MDDFEKFVGTLHKRNVIYHGDLTDLADKYDQMKKVGAGQYIGQDQECVALPQFLTDVGYTGRWQPGPRVVDLEYLPPGTVIANFLFENGKARFPCKTGWHAALFDQFCRGTVMADGKPCEFVMFDQFHGKPAARRWLPKLTSEWRKAHPGLPGLPNDAAEFYVVVVP